MPVYIEITEDEAWAIDHTVRHTFMEAGANVGRELLLKVMSLVLEFEERRGKPFAPVVLPLAATEEECWAMDHQIRCDLTVNGKPVGRAILLKVFRALAEYANARDSESGVERLGHLAARLRAPAAEELPDGDRDHRSPPSTSRDDPPGSSDSGWPRPSPDDGASGPLPRGK